MLSAIKINLAVHDFLRVNVISRGRQSDTQLLLTVLSLYLYFFVYHESDST